MAVHDVSTAARTTGTAAAPAGADRPLLAVNNVEVVYGVSLAVRGVSFVVPENGVVALLAGCSSSSSKTTTSTSAGSTTPSSSSLTSAAPSGSPPSESQLAEIVLQPSDLPADSTPQPYEPTPGEVAVQDALLKCLGLLSIATDKVAEAHSDGFKFGDGDVTSVARSYRSQSAVDAYVAALHGSKFSPCFERSIKQLIAPQVAAGGATETVSVKTTPGSAGGPANVVGTVVGTIKISQGGEQAVVYIRFTYITGPLIWAEIDAENPGAPIPASVMETPVAGVADRAAAQA
jgi:hypothetical protein